MMVFVVRVLFVVLFYVVCDDFFALFVGQFVRCFRVCLCVVMELLLALFVGHFVRCL